MYKVVQSQMCLQLYWNAVDINVVFSSTTLISNTGWKSSSASVVAECLIYDPAFY